MNVSEVELVYRSKVKAALRPTVRQSNQAHEVLMEIWRRDKIELLEEFKVLFLNQRNKVLGVYEMSSGGLTGTVADIRLIFAAALKMCANQLVIDRNKS